MRRQPVPEYNGQRFISSTTDTPHPLCVVRGYVDSAGAKTGGDGFTSSKTSTGQYAVVFSPPFSDAPVVTVTTLSSSPLVARFGTAPSRTGFTVFTFQTTDGNVGDSAFFFQAIGQRT